MSDILNLGIKLIMDKGNNKTYLSIDGNIENAPESERIEVRDALVEAFSKILKINTEDDIYIQENNDFVEKEELPEIDIFEEMMEDAKEKKLQDKVIEEVEEVKEEITKEVIEEQKIEDKSEQSKVIDWDEFKNKQSIKMGFGKYSNYNPFEIIALYKEEGIKELLSLKIIFQRNADRYKINGVKIEAINNALELYEEVKVA